MSINAFWNQNIYFNCSSIKNVKKKKYNEYGIGEDYTPSSLEDRCKTNTGVTQTQL